MNENYTDMKDKVEKLNPKDMKQIIGGRSLSNKPKPSDDPVIIILR